MKISSLAFYATPFDDTYKNVIDINNVGAKNSAEVRTAILTQIATRYSSSLVSVTITGDRAINFDERGGKVVFTLDTLTSTDYLTFIGYNYAIVNSNMGYFVKNIRQLNSQSQYCTYEADLELDIWTYAYPLLITNTSIEKDAIIEKSHSKSYSVVLNDKVVKSGERLPIKEYNLLTKKELFVDTDFTYSITNENVLFIAVKLKQAFSKESGIVGYVGNNDADLNAAFPPFLTTVTYYIPFIYFTNNSTNIENIDIVSKYELLGVETDVIRAHDFVKTYGLASPYIDRMYLTYNVPFTYTIVNDAEGNFEYVKMDQNSRCAKTIVKAIIDEGDGTFSDVVIANDVIFPLGVESASDIDELKEKCIKYVDYSNFYKSLGSGAIGDLLTDDDIYSLCIPFLYYPYTYPSIMVGGKEIPFITFYTGENDLDFEFICVENGIIMKFSQENNGILFHNKDFDIDTLEIDKDIPFYGEQYQSYKLANSNKIRAELENAETNRATKFTISALTGTGALTSMLIGGVNPVIGVAGVAGAVANALNAQEAYNETIRNVNASKNDAKNLPSVLKNAGLSAYLNFLTLDRIFIIKTSVIKSEESVEYAKDVYMEGYDKNIVSNPFENNKNVYDYCKTNACNFDANINKSYIARINQIFNNGVTKWHFDTAPNNQYVNALNKHSNNQDKEA